MSNKNQNMLFLLYLCLRYFKFIPCFFFSSIFPFFFLLLLLMLLQYKNESMNVKTNIYTEPERPLPKEVLVEVNQDYYFPRQVTRSPKNFENRMTVTLWGFFFFFSFFFPLLLLFLSFQETSLACFIINIYNGNNVIFT